MPIFIYKCTSCGKKNDTANPPEDSMLNCARCGWLTVQTCIGAKANIREDKQERLA